MPEITEVTDGEAAGEAFLQALYEALATQGVRKGQCELDHNRGMMVVNVGKGGDGTTRAIPVTSLAARYASCKTEELKAQLLEATAEAFGAGAADVPKEYEACGARLLPQLWPVSKLASMQMSLPTDVGLPHCGLHGEAVALKPASDPLAQELAVVLVCEYASEAACEAGVPVLHVETPVLTTDLTRWNQGFVEVLRAALENLRARTKAGPGPEKRWEHHASGCGQTAWGDRFDSARIALLPALVAKRKRPDGIPDLGGHVVSFATTSCALATMSKNPLGLCFLGDTLNTKIKPTDGTVAANALLTTTPYRLLKMKDSAGDAATRNHPLNQKASEGFIWRWMPYSPSGPPLRTAGEFSVPIDAGEVEAILNAAEAGQPVPVFKHGDDRASPPRPTFKEKKEEANVFFRAGNFVKAIAAYDAALAVTPPPSDAEAAIAHCNAAQALLKLAELDPPRREPCAAEALRRASRAAELDPAYEKAHARCALACDILGESSAAEEFRARAQACSGTSLGKAAAASTSSSSSSGLRSDGHAQAQKIEA